MWRTPPAVIFVKDTQGRYLLISRRYEMLFGLKREQFVGRTDHDAHPKEVAEALWANDRKVLETGQPLEFEELVWHGGSAHTYMSVKFPIFDPSGKPFAVCGIATDITERKRSESALRETEDRYCSVIAAMHDGVVLLDADGSIRACNPSAERILGLPADQLVGRTSLDPRRRTIHEDGSSFPGEIHPAMVTLRTGRPCSNVVMGVHKPDGSLTWISVRSQPLVRPGETAPYAVVASFEEITDHKRLEEALAQTTTELARARQQLQQR